MFGIFVKLKELFYKKSDKNIKNDGFKYLDNAPTFKEEYKLQASVISDAIKNKDINNIGVIASYGSGKSSIIKTFKTNYHAYRRKVFEISLANFKEPKTDNFDDGLYLKILKEND